MYKRHYQRKVISFYSDEETTVALDAVCERTGMNRSEAIRQAIKAMHETTTKKDDTNDR